MTDKKKMALRSLAILSVFMGLFIAGSVIQSIFLQQNPDSGTCVNETCTYTKGGYTTWASEIEGLNPVSVAKPLQIYLYNRTSGDPFTNTSIAIYWANTYNNTSTYLETIKTDNTGRAITSQFAYCKENGTIKKFDTAFYNPRYNCMETDWLPIPSHWGAIYKTGHGIVLKINISNRGVVKFVVRQLTIPTMAQSDAEVERSHWKNYLEDEIKPYYPSLYKFLKETKRR